MVDDPSELVVPKATAEFGCAVVFTFVIVVSSILAAQNLLHRVAVIPSAFWLLIIAVAVLSNVKASGIRGLWFATLSGFSRRQVLQVCAQPGEAIALRLGSKLFRSNIIEYIVPAANLVCVSWNTGQATDLAGHDMNDWHVVLWYRHGDPVREAREQQLGLRRPGQAPLIIGPPRPRQVTEELGARVLEFLRQNNISVAFEETRATKPQPNGAA